MFETIRSQKIAGFRLGGERVDIVPSEMTKSADSYSKKVGDLTVILHFEELAPDCYRWHLILRNTGKTRTAQITELYGADIHFAVSGEAKWESLFGDNWTENSFKPLSADFSDMTVIEREPADGRSSREGFPYFDVTSDLGCMVFAIGWSGQWKYKLRRMGDTALLKLGFADCDMYLDPGESIRSAGAIVCGGRTLTETRQKFRRIFREKLSPYAKRGAGFTLPISLQTFDRYFPTGQPWATPDPTWATEEGQLRCIECAKKCGLINNYWLDAAWFRDGFPHGVGNYTCEKTFPRGLAPLSKAAHSLGMTFMLWFEVERVNINSDTAKEHPEWLLWNGDPENPYRIFNIGNEEAYRRLRDTLVDMVQKSGIDIFRLDFNRGPLLYWRRHEEPGRKGYLENKHITNLYRLWDELLREFPGLLIDNCAGGGGRLDYELLSRSVPLWRSDSGCYPVSEEHPTDIWHQNQTIGLTRYLPYHSTCSWTTEAYTFRSSSTMGIALDLDVMNDAFDGESTKAPLSELHSLRHLWNGDFYPLTEATLRDDVWCAYQLDLEGNGFAAFFRRENAESSEMTFTLNNIDTDKDYEITLSDENYEKTVKVVKGKDLASFTAHIPEAKQSLLLTYKTV